MIDRNEMVAEVLALYDALDATRADGTPAYKARFYDEGRKAVYHSAVPMPFLLKDADGGAECYESWLHHELSCIPEWMSRDEFKAEYADELQRDYDALVAKHEDNAD